MQVTYFWPYNSVRVCRSSSLIGKSFRPNSKSWVTMSDNLNHEKHPVLYLVANFCLQKIKKPHWRSCSFQQSECRLGNGWKSARRRNGDGGEVISTPNVQYIRQTLMVFISSACSVDKSVQPESNVIENNRVRRTLFLSDHWVGLYKSIPDWGSVRSKASDCWLLKRLREKFNWTSGLWCIQRNLTPSNRAADDRPTIKPIQKLCAPIGSTIQLIRPRCNPLVNRKSISNESSIKDSAHVFIPTQCTCDGSLVRHR